MGPQIRVSLVALLVLVASLWSNAPVVEGASLRNNFYAYSCPNVENIVFQSMKKSFAKDKTVAAGIVRLIFHDCFVRIICCSDMLLFDLPPATFNSTQLIANFAAKGLSAQQMVDLSGSHTLGVTHCVQLRDRIFTPVDPTMPKDLLKSLQKKCPSIGTPTPLTIDQYSPNKFDTVYYQNLVKGRGLMTSDQTLYRDPATRPFVKANLRQKTFDQRWLR